MQLDFFGSRPKPQTEQQRQLKRVRGRIGPSIVDFLRSRGVGGTFHAEELHQWVKDDIAAAPASADRVLRDLRARQVVGYEIVNRSKSLYRITSLHRSDSPAVAAG